MDDSVEFVMVLCCFQSSGQYLYFFDIQYLNYYWPTFSKQQYFHNEFSNYFSHLQYKMTKLQKSFQDYFRIPVLLKTLGSTSFQTLSVFVDALNTVQQFQIQPISQQYLIKISNNNQLANQLKEQITNRPSSQRQKLLFMTQQFQTDWPQFQFIYKSKFIIAVYQPHSQKGLAQYLQKLNKTLKQQNCKLVGIVFLNDQKNEAKDLTEQTKFTILPANLSNQQTAVFIQPWLEDIVVLIQQKLISFLFQYRQEQNIVVVFNKNQQKSQPKIMKKKKKYRCVKLCADIALMLHFYKLAYQTYNQAEQQLRKIDDYLWVLGCIQGKLACMTSQFYTPIQNQNFQEKVQQLIEQSYSLGKKIKIVNLQIQNNFKILKLFMDEPERFQQMLQNIMANIRLTTEQQKFTYFIYIGSLYEKCGMIRKRNYYYYLSSLIYLNIKTDISLILLKKIKQSHSLRQWEQLHSKVIKLIIDQQGFFNKFGESQLELLEQCNSVLSKKDISITLDNLNFNNYDQINLKEAYSIVQVREFNIEESNTKPKLNRIGNLESPKRSSSTIFMGWKKNQNYLFQEDELIVFKGSIFNKMTFPVHLTVELQINIVQKSYRSFQLLLNPLSSVKFSKQFSFKYSEEPIQIKALKLKIWNFIFSKDLKPSIKFQTYEKQPNIQLVLPQVMKIEESQKFSLSGVLNYEGKIKCDKIRLTVCVYYDIDVGFQQNQYEIQNVSSNQLIKQNKQNIFLFKQSEEASCSFNFGQKQNFVFVLKKLKAERKHVKKMQISLQYIQSMQSKYQIQKQYCIPTQIINSIWGELIQYETVTDINYKTKTKHGFKQIDDYYVARVQFFKNNNNLAPYRIKYCQENKQTQQIILSDKTSQFIRIRLPKIFQDPKINISKKQLTNEKDISDQKGQINQQAKKAMDLIFFWQNVVNPQINGRIRIKQQFHEIMFKPSYKIKVWNQKLSDSCFKIGYSIESQQKQTLNHRLSIHNSEDDSDQFVVKGKIKIQNLNRKDCIKNEVTLKFVQSEQKKQKNKQICFSIQFQNRWKHQSIICLK